MKYSRLYKNCKLCPRACKVDRTSMKTGSGTGFCGEKDIARVAYIGPHFGEEPPFTGKNGSGTVFFSGCSLRCSFCQNYQISHMGIGRVFEGEELIETITDMIAHQKVHNINFVTPDHFFPHVFSIVAKLKQMGIFLPFVYNLSGYQSLDMLKIAENFVDIYLPDFKYSDSKLSERLSNCPDYPQISINAIREMVNQKGFLDACIKNGTMAQTGVLVRHLILPGQVENSINALSMLFLEFGSKMPLSLMSQYYPVKSIKNGLVDRALLQIEFKRVYEHCIDLGFEFLFVQFPKDSRLNRKKLPPFLPDFTLEQPFRQY